MMPANLVLVESFQMMSGNLSILHNSILNRSNFCANLTKIKNFPDTLPPRFISSIILIAHEDSVRTHESGLYGCESFHRAGPRGQI